MPTSAPAALLRFDQFELDVAAYQLRRRGRPVRLERQPMDVLILLVERRRQLVSRAEIVERLWGTDVFVDVETGVHTAIRKIRRALGDSTTSPAFVETVPGKGYRFVADVTVASIPTDQIAPTHMSPSVDGASTDAVRTEDRPPTLPAVAPADVVAPAAAPTSHLGRGNRLVIALIAIAMVSAFVGWTWLQRETPNSQITVAVLPFAYLGNDPERAYLAAGLTEETSASLAQIDRERLIVKGRTLGYTGTTKTAVQLGQELSVDYLVQSTIRAERGRLRVTATLIRVRDQEHVWSQSYEREPASLLGLQQELSSTIAEQVLARLSPDRVDVGRRQTQNADAYEAYLRGRYLQSRRTPATNAAAIEQYDRAITLDAGYALAWSGLTLTYAASALNGDGRPLEVWPLARDAAARAVRANPNLGEAQLALGYVKWLLDWDWRAAESALRVAVRIDPSNAAAHRSLGHALSQSGKHEEAQAAMRRARELEPLEPANHALSAQTAFQARDYPAALDEARRAILLDSQFWIGYMQLAQVYEQTGDTDLALSALTDAARFSGSNSKVTSLRGYLLAKSGRTDDAREVLTQMEFDSRDRYVPPAAIALVYAGLGEREPAMQWLAKAYDEHDVHLIYLTVDPKWDSYRADPRFQALLARCGFVS
jgi:TolB-like protein/DNA-binding winged helix-turn-helix (wHTH) protein/Flp pilus assembly protein TadD